MSLAQAIQDVCKEPASIQARAKLVRFLELHGVKETFPYWEATVQLAINRGQFFPGMSICRVYVPKEHQEPLLAKLAARFGAERPKVGQVMPPPITKAKEVQIPSALPEQVQLGKNIALDISDLSLPEGAVVSEPPLFGGLTQDAFVAVSKNMKGSPLQKGTKLIQQNDVEQALYILAYGKVEVTQTQADGSINTLAQIKAPAIIGEMSLLTAVPRRATVTALENGLVWQIDSQQLESISKEHPSVVDELLSMVKLRLLNNLLQSSQLFKNIRKLEQNRLLESFDIQSFTEKTEVFQQDVAPPGLYVLLHGLAEVWNQSKEHARIRIATLSEGDIFGEMSLLMEQSTTASVWLPEGGVVLHLPAEKYNAIRKNLPQVNAELDLLAAYRQGELQSMVAPIEGEYEEVDDAWLLEEITV